MLALTTVRVYFMACHHVELKNSYASKTQLPYLSLQQVVIIYHTCLLNILTLATSPVASHVQFKVLLLIYKALNGLSPSYILDLLKKYCPRRQFRSSNRLLLSVLAVNTVTYGPRSSVCPCCQYCYLWSTFFCPSLLLTLLLTVKSKFFCLSLLSTLLSTFFCRFLLLTLLPMVHVLLSVPAANTVTYSIVKVLLSVPAVNTVTYGQHSSVFPCC